MSKKRQDAIAKLERARSGKLRHLKRAREEGDRDSAAHLFAEIRDVEWAIAEMQREDQHEAERDKAHAEYMAKRRGPVRRMNPRRRAMMRRAS